MRAYVRRGAAGPDMARFTAQLVSDRNNY